MADVFIETCLVDGGELLEGFDADEHGVYSWFGCEHGHTYRAGWTGMQWLPIDQGDYDEVKHACRYAGEPGAGEFAFCEECA